MPEDAMPPDRARAPWSPAIVDDARLVDLCRELRRSGSFALDTEFIRERTYRPRLCLLQIATGGPSTGGVGTGGVGTGGVGTGGVGTGGVGTSEGRSWVVDPLALGDLGPFLELVRDPGVEKIVHSGEQDMEIFFSIGRQAPRNIFDTQVAAALAGHGESVSYGRLVEEICGVRLEKGETYTDWARRPLSTDQVEYALDDVRYLPGMAEILRRKLGEKGRLEWVADELRFYEEAATYERSAEEAFRRVRGAGRLGPRELAVLRALAAWREEEAEAMDRPRARILTDEILVELARRGPRTVAAIAAVRGVHPQLVRRSGTEILRRVAAALSLPPSELPVPVERPADSPDREALADLLDVVVRARAAELEIAPAYIAARKDLAELVRRHLDPAAASGGGAGRPLPILSGWRRSLVGETVLAVLRGERSVAVGGGGGRVEILPTGGDASASGGHASDLTPPAGGRGA